MRTFHAKAHPEAKKFDGGLGEERGTETGLLGCVYVILGKGLPTHHEGFQESWACEACN